MVENAIQGLHRKGFAVMMDDFGSGYSSLNMLKDTNVDAIKLDMKLIDMNQENRSKGVQIVESVVDMAHRLNLPIIAEGVETPEQVSMLQAADCLYSQGYYFFKPMPVENAEKLLADPTNQDYWDLRRDLMRRDRRVENPGTEKTALALQAYQIFTDNVLEISLLNLATGAYRVIKRDARLLGADLEKEEDFVNYCDRLVNEKIVHEEDADLFWSRPIWRPCALCCTTPPRRSSTATARTCPASISGSPQRCCPAGAAVPRTRGRLCWCAMMHRPTSSARSWTSLTATIP